MGKFTKLGGGKQRASGLLIAFLLAASLLPLVATIGGSVKAQIPEAKFNVAWRLVRDGIIHKIYEIDVQNLLGEGKKANILSLFENTSFDISELKNVRFYEWKDWKQVEVPIYDNVAENCTVENVLSYENVTSLENENYSRFYGDWDEPNYAVLKVSDNRENVAAGYENIDNSALGSVYIEFTAWNVVGYENKMKNDWKPCKMLMFDQTDKIYKENYGVITIPKFWSNPKYDDFGSVITENGTKRFRLEFEVQIQPKIGGWGSSGKVALIIDGGVWHPWWDDNWSYRAPITLTIGENVPPENYQYRIVLDKADNLNNHCLDNFQDVRFLEDEGSGELSFWIENYISGDNAIIWVRREENSLSDNQIYVYYGNASAGSAENGDATFVLFDDFNDDSLDSNKWNVVRGTVNEANQRIEMQNRGYLASVADMPDDARVFAQYLVTDDRNNIDFCLRSDATPNGVFDEVRNAVYAFDFIGDDSPFSLNIRKREDGSQTVLATTTHSLSEGTWYDGMFCIYGPNADYDAKCIMAGTELNALNESYSPSATSKKLLFYCREDTVIGWAHLDNVRVTKYVSPEPTASAGAEETAAVAPSKPVLVSPENNYSTSDNTPTFVWENGSDATSHRLVIDNDINFADGDNIYDNATAWDNSGTEIENELPPDNYWWKICATNATGDNWSENTWKIEITANHAPTTPTSLALTPSPCYITDELTGAGGGSTDADGDGITYYYAFYNETDSTMRQDWNTDNSYTLIVALDAHDNIRVFVMAYDGYENSADNLENSVVITDTLPTKPTTIALSPDPIYVGDTLTALASGHSDADDDMMFIYYSFYNENDSITRQGPHVNDEYVIQSVDAHDNIRVFAYIYTLYGESPSPHFDNSIIIGNTKPIAENQETDGETNPTDVASDTPVLSWDYQDNDGDVQENFQIQVGTAADGSDMWDNNQQNSDSYITYAGSALTEGTTYYWRVRVHDNYEWSGWLSGGTFVITPNEPPDTPTVTEPPDGYDATVGEGISFSGSATDPDGDELTYEWDFGDGTGTSDEADTTHTYSSPGDYTVTLTVTDPDGETSTTTIIINVTSAWGPGAPGWVPPEEPPLEEPPPIVGIPKPALPIAGAWGVLLAVCAVYLSSLKDGPLKRRWAHDISKWIIPTFAVLTLLYIRTEGIAITPIMAVVGAWILIFAVVALHFSSIAPGHRRQEWTKQFLKFVLPTLIILTIAYLRINGMV